MIKLICTNYTTGNTTLSFSHRMFKDRYEAEKEAGYLSVYATRWGKATVSHSKQAEVIKCVPLVYLLYISKQNHVTGECKIFFSKEVFTSREEAEQAAETIKAEEIVNDEEGRDVLRSISACLFELPVTRSVEGGRDVLIDLSTAQRWAKEMRYD